MTLLSVVALIELGQIWNDPHEFAQVDHASASEIAITRNRSKPEEDTGICDCEFLFNGPLSLGTCVVLEFLSRGFISGARARTQPVITEFLKPYCWSTGQDHGLGKCFHAIKLE
jgi:hypothetical protein